jgi:hypothetical protein
MTDGGSMTDISPSTFTAAGEKVAGLLERAAIPGKPPVAVPGTSPADTAAATLATTMGTRITAASAELAPRGPAMRTAAQSAAAEIQAQDLKNAEDIKRRTALKEGYDKIVQGIPGAGNGAPTPPSIHSGPGVPPPPGFWDNWFTTKDTVNAAVGAGVGAKADFSKYMVDQAMKGPASGAPPSWVKTAFTDIKGSNFTDIKGISSITVKGVSPVGGALAAPFLVWNIADNMREDGNSIWQATAREGGGFLAGAWAGALVGSAIPIPVVGTVTGLVVGGLVGMGAGKFIDKAWEPVGDAVENAAGSVVKALGNLFG